MNSHVIITAIYAAALMLFGACSTDTGIDKTGELFGAWQLERIKYDTGEVLTPDVDQLYWFDLREDLVEAEGGVHHLVKGGAFCNWAEGWFDYSDDGEINIAFICSRLVCGIATEFCTGVSTSSEYAFRNGRLVLSFDSAAFGPGNLILKPFKP